MTVIKDTDFKSMFAINGVLHDFPCELFEYSANNDYNRVFPNSFFVRFDYPLVWYWICFFWDNVTTKFILNGSPGIGKSILCFLFAFRVSLIVPVLYIRFVGTDKNIWILNKGEVHLLDKFFISYLKDIENFFLYLGLRFLLMEWFMLMLNLII